MELHVEEVSVVLLVILVFVVVKRLRKPYGFPPGPPALPLVGSAPFLPADVINGTGPRLDDYLADKYGDIVGFYGGRRPMVFVSDVEIVKRLFKMEEVSERPRLMPYHKMRYGSKASNRLSRVSQRFS